MKFSLLEQSKELRDLFFHYPSFVHSYNSKILKDEIPVFVYHSINPILFELQLKFLKENNYTTLSIRDFEAIISNNRAKCENSVLLTVDDARLSFWKYGYPLLKKYNMKSTVFMIPGRTIENEPKRENLEDLWNSRISLSELEAIDRQDLELCNWNEIKEMYSSNLISIESHTLFHRESFTSPILKDIISSSSLFYQYNSDFSPYLTKEHVGKKINLEDYFGYPVFRTSPLLLADDEYLVDSELIIFCKNLFLKKKNENNWKRKIFNEINKKLESEDFKLVKVDGRKSLLDDLHTAKEIIKEKLDKNAGNSICLPWTIGSESAIEVMKEIGISSCFWGVLENKKINKPGDDPFKICRIKNDFIFRLPSKHRKSLAKIYFEKVMRRFKGESIY